MAELECKDCLFCDSCRYSVYEVPCGHFAAVGSIEEMMLDLAVDTERDEYRMAWYDYVSEFDADFSF